MYEACISCEYYAKCFFFLFIKENGRDAEEIVRIYSEHVQENTYNIEI